MALERKASAASSSRVRGPTTTWPALAHGCCNAVPEPDPLPPGRSEVVAAGGGTTTKTPASPAAASEAGVGCAWPDGAGSASRDSPPPSPPAGSARGGVSTTMSSSTSDSPSAGSVHPAGSVAPAGCGSMIVTAGSVPLSISGQAGSAVTLARFAEALSHARAEASSISFSASARSRQASRLAAPRSWPD